MDFMNMFAMAGNYEDRKVGRWDSKDGTKMVSTCSVTDGSHPYETAFTHPNYNDGKMIIVQAYDTKDSALAGHGKWLNVMQKGPLPKVLKDINNAVIAQLGAAFGIDRTYKAKKAKKKTVSK